MISFGIQYDLLLYLSLALNIEKSISHRRSIAFKYLDDGISLKYQFI